jgi:hypothetical protein
MYIMTAEKFSATINKGQKSRHSGKLKSSLDTTLKPEKEHMSRKTWMYDIHNL